MELAAGFYVTLGLVLGETGYMTEAYAFARPISPLLLFVMVTAVRRDIVKCCGWARSGGVFLNHQSILENLSL